MHGAIIGRDVTNDRTYTTRNGIVEDGQIGMKCVKVSTLKDNARSSLNRL